MVSKVAIFVTFHGVRLKERERERGTILKSSTKGVHHKNWEVCKAKTLFTQSGSRELQGLLVERDGGRRKLFAL